MSVSEVITIVSLFFMASVKYLIAAGYLMVSNHHWIVSMIVCASGGIFGVLIFTFLGQKLSAYLHQYAFFRPKWKRKKTFVKLKRGYGLIGIAAITPLIISIPVGCILSTAITSDKAIVLRYQIGSVIIWSIMLFSIKGIFNINLSSYF